MYLATFIVGDKEDWGIVRPELGLICPALLWLDDRAPLTLLEFIRLSGASDGKMLLPEAPLPSDQWLSLDDVELLAPIPNPARNIFCVGKNYLDHIEELNKDRNISGLNTKYPQYFTKATHTVTGPFAEISLHSNVTSQVDYEAELAVIIGKRGINIPEEEAMDYVFGYTILNDVTARDLQRNHNQWFKGKSLDGFCPMGPWIVTKDEIGDPVELNISSKVNGELRQSSNTRNMIFSIPKLISILSQGLTLEPGDILATGTPAGVGMGFDPPRFLKPGDVVRIEIEKIGYIENRFVK
ncbi:2-keto-4-pentenoate hydratase/2-oxohepta-3-ene-1,7-dioic acid hydratase in catechol pathway [Caldicoprobacter guelmensis]|uniref:fumarylacetoacetate hydrolase family protein n=1 Tax=Caldicoprobacter guelmensis TaxID=1170224 RepID=UPI0019593A98|nr:fumarylacetoacetate hydrolase family protein [Caldicoprobacter guelmensis]MBM7581610.1 2-keto-4-pentenoate hydratase/2-oxohepta-3-ene-1,7-dioic acid hydratase in catechol pathway [Caldicoprobacter guelmensis]